MQANIVSVLFEQTQEQNKQQDDSLSSQLALACECSASGKTVLSQRYMSYPLSVSPVFRLDEDATRAYLYRMNTSPGLLAGDVLKMSVKLGDGSALLLADQAATKVHTMPTEGALENRRAAVRYEIEVGDRATLEFLPEPLILFTDSVLNQTTDIVLHPSAGLTWGEIILPGRLARGERYQFESYWSRLQIRSYGNTSGLGDLPKEGLRHRTWFIETMKLLGRNNPFTNHLLFASGSVLGSLILVLPKAQATPENLKILSQKIDQLSSADPVVEIASSVLPGERGLFVRAIAQTTRDLQSSFKSAANYVRQLRNQPNLPYSL
ncbi:MAG: urease accessory protein UreD [Cyanobacteria bacterium J06576_12]